MIPYNGENIKKAKRLRKEMTPWERKIWLLFLKNYPLHIYKQRVIKNYIVDFYCPKAKLAIELDGSQHYENKNIKKDKERSDNLEKLGIAVLRINNNDVDKNFREVCEHIDNKIKERYKTSLS